MPNNFGGDQYDPDYKPEEEVPKKMKRQPGDVDYLIKEIVYRYLQGQDSTVKLLAMHTAWSDSRVRDTLRLIEIDRDLRQKVGGFKLGNCGHAARTLNYQPTKWYLGRLLLEKGWTR